ncbi:unnamed protein product [Parnassius mnemosyne]|uniref:MADF domain-containing protein n=2 Tax=Parnassius mnemosyne TaxID=213953 RepID=A0AAV1LRW9_9NEOP
MKKFLHFSRFCKQCHVCGIRDSKLFISTQFLKNRTSQNDAWRRIVQVLSCSQTTVEEIRKKKESLIGYYRTHLNKYKKSLKSGAGKNDVYATNWFAFETMDSFLRGVYESNHTLNTVTNEDSESQERNEGINDQNNNSPHFSLEIEEDSQNTQGGNRSRSRENKSSQDSGRKRQLSDYLPPEIRAARRQIDEAFEYIKKKTDDEYEMFGKLIASKLKKIRNPNTRDILMNEIHILVFRTCMADRLEQQSVVPQFPTFQTPHHQVFSLSPRPSTHQSPPGQFKSHSPHHQVFSPSPNLSTHQSPPGQSTSQSPHHQVFSPSPNLSTHQSPPGQSTSQSPHHQVYSSSPNPSTHQSPPGQSTSQSPHHEVFSQSPNPSTHQTPPDQFKSYSPHHEVFSPPPNQSTHQSPPSQSTSKSPHHQVFSPSPNPSTYQSPPGQSTSQSPHHQVFSSSPNPSTYRSPPGQLKSHFPHHQVFSLSRNPSTYQSPPGQFKSHSPHHQEFSPSPNPSTYQSLSRHEINSPSSPLDHYPVQSSQENFLELPPSRASQIVITDTGKIMIIKD